MNKFVNMSPELISENAISLIGKEWMLITTTFEGKINMMTASWGGLGFLWGLPVSFIFVRPQRYTYALLEHVDTYTLSFYAPEYRDVLNMCGTRSGRDIDKVAESGLTPVSGGQGVVYFAEAHLVLVCRKLYTHVFDKTNFVDVTIPPNVYAAGDFHKMYVGEIIQCLKR